MLEAELMHDMVWSCFNLAQNSWGPILVEIIHVALCYAEKTADPRRIQSPVVGPDFYFYFYFLFFFVGGHLLFYYLQNWLIEVKIAPSPYNPNPPFITRYHIAQTPLACSP